MDFIMNEEKEFSVNKRIRMLREFLKLSRDEFALKLHIKSNQLANIETNKQKAPAWYIEAINEEWSEYGYWLGTGKTLPEAGQISPEIEQRMH